MVQWIFANDQRLSKNPDLQNIEFKKKKKTKKTDFEFPRNEYTSLNNLVVSQMLAK